MENPSETRTREYRDYIEQFLKDHLSAFGEEPQKQLFDAMGYSLLAGGKRLRPIFAFEFCRMAGGDWKTAAPLAAAVEMIHTYSLIHDDLPAMDNDDYRRGRLTNHKVYGEAMAILAGDALLTDAFSLAAQAKIPAENAVFALSVLSECAGSRGMVGGQVLDILSEERVCSEQEVLDIQTRKTGALINAACVLGVIAAGGTDEQIAAAAQFAGLIGLAFQIRDDMLDVLGDAKTLGKAVHVDANKGTFVRLYGLERCGQMIEEENETAVAALDAFGETAFLKELVQRLAVREF